MNQNLINPEIVTRLARERELEMRREMRGLSEVEMDYSGKRPSAPKARMHKPRLVALLAWLFA